MADLREVERARKQQTSLVDFVAGAHDQLRRLHVSQKLYGREDEVKRLTHNFELVCEGSPMMATLVLVHGYSGVIHASPRFFLLFLLFVLITQFRLARQFSYTKSTNLLQGDMGITLVASLTSSTPRAHTWLLFRYFIFCDKSNRLTSTSQAIQQLLQQILTESEEQVLSWKQRILKGVGNCGQIVIDIIPELELIIGNSSSLFIGRISYLLLLFRYTTRSS